MTEEEAKKYCDTKNNVMWILDENKNPINATPLEFGEFFDSKNERVNIDSVSGKLISTMFLGIDVSFGIYEKPLFFETMIFENGKYLLYQKRYSTYQEAEEKHKITVQWVKDGCK